MEPLSDEQKLLARLRDGDESALDAAFSLFYRYLFKIAFSILGNEAEAKDAVQEVFARFWQKRAEIEVKMTLKGYLQRAIVNQSLGVLRQRKNFQRPDEAHFLIPDDAPSPLEKAENASLADAVRTAIDRLPEQRRAIFRLSRLDELSHREIAEKLGLSPKTVENQIGKALKDLRETLAPFFRAVFFPVAAAIEKYFF